MNSDILQCIQIRKDFFEKYYTVPAHLQVEVDAFLESLHALGEQSADAVDFEAKFAQSGFQDKLNALLVCCTPKAYEMTKEEKAAAKETAKEIFREDRSRIIKEAADDVLDHAGVMLEEELIAKKREAMIEDGVFDEYTRVTNAIDMAEYAGGFLKNLFKKKK